MTETHPAEQQIWRLAYLHLDPDRESPEWYLLVNEGPVDRVLARDGRILVFTDPAAADRVIDRFGADLPADDRDLEEPFFRGHLAQTLYLLTSGEADESRFIIDTANLLLDLIATTGRPVPEHHGRRLKALADHFTFASEPKGFFADSGIAPDAIVETLLWATGLVMLHLSEVRP
ncbi:hypothetical protein SCOR_29560 [Sulfidibacter corallicola]|uniref:Uncharacterized protein n=1 Tax=Sulfidibacter corallicola TaxID=2818388 RepID=A0A8A4TUU2_SULCO|nr:hypothetical protein [Sulfidibacter corallicola]QTD50295.1 hypothetical protein J3U87_32320 [Sulfidibacter corallicola]